MIVIEIPPLREREGDLPLLIRYSLDRLKANRATRFESVSREALGLMQRYRWPGNVRELENVIERIVTLNDDVVIKPEHLPQELTGPSPGDPHRKRPFASKSGGFGIRGKGHDPSGPDRIPLQ